MRPVYTGRWLNFIGVLECLLAFAASLGPAVGFLLFVLAWKLATELLIPMTGPPIWAFIKDSGSDAFDMEGFRQIPGTR
jgi:hypothetical protein